MTRRTSYDLLSWVCQISGTYPLYMTIGTIKAGLGFYSYGPYLALTVITFVGAILFRYLSS